jgi:hypothetical protein
MRPMSSKAAICGLGMAEMMFANDAPTIWRQKPCTWPMPVSTNYSSTVC